MVHLSNAHEQFSFVCVLRVLYIEDPNEHICVTSVQIETCVKPFLTDFFTATVPLSTHNICFW